MPFIVGSPRSGTTLLRLMVDSHPLLAIPPETGFFFKIARFTGTADERRAEFGARLTRSTGIDGSWRDFGLSSEEFLARLQSIQPFDVAEGLRLFYRMYADTQSKPRWGDKTPLYCRNLCEIQDLLPEARFIHILRDGRDVAASLRRQWFSPGPSIEAQALYWRRNVEAARQHARRCRHYHEVRYEDLVRDPEPALRRICSFIELDFDAAMLRYWQRAPERLTEHAARVRENGEVMLSAEQRRSQQSHVLQPPDAGRIGTWKSTLTRVEKLRFRLVAGGLVRALGYSW